MTASGLALVGLVAVAFRQGDDLPQSLHLGPYLPEGSGDGKSPLWRAVSIAVTAGIALSWALLLRRQPLTAAVTARRTVEHVAATVPPAGPYRDVSALLAAVRDGDVLLLRGRWLMERAGYREVSHDWTSQHKLGVREAWEESAVRALPLPSRQEIEAHHPEAILPAAELERLYGALRQSTNEGHRSLSSLGSNRRFNAAPIVSVSYCWEDVAAPDPEARTLRAIAGSPALQGRWRGEEPTSGLPLYAAWGFWDVGVFIE